MPGYCTFTATRVPSASVARCTCPIEAAAIGRRSIRDTSSSPLAPSSSFTTASMLENGTGGELVWSVARTRRTSSGNEASV